MFSVSFISLESSLFLGTLIKRLVDAFQCESFVVGNAS